MTDKRIQMGKAPQVTVMCRGDLAIRGWAELDILIKGDKFETVESEKGLSLTGTGDLKMYVPVTASVTVAENAGDLLVKNLEGDLVLADIKGDLTLRNLGNVTIDSVNGDLSGRKLEGSLYAGQIKGDLSLKNLQSLEVEIVDGDCSATDVNGNARLNVVNGDISLKIVKGDVNIELGQGRINLRNLSGVNTVQMASGDIRIRGALAPGKHNFSSDGDILLHWPVGAPFHLEAHADQIHSKVDLVDILEEEAFMSGSHGNGDTFLILNAKGRIIIKELAASTGWDSYQEADVDFEVDLNGLGDYIAFEINNRMNDWSTRVEQKFGPAFVSQIEKTAYEAAAKAEKAAEKAVRKAEKAAKNARWQSGWSSWTGGTTFPSRSQNKEKKASEEEQIKILRMVEQGTITPEEASTLLEALGS